MPEAPGGESARLEAAYRRRRAEDGAPARLRSPGDLFILQERERHLAATLRASYPQGLGTLDILDFGCGSGWDVLELLGLGARPERIAGVDLLGSRLTRARRMLPATALSRADGSRLPFRDASFDLILQYTVFSSILDPVLRRRVAEELGRVLRAGGSLLWYDLRANNPRNPDVRRIGRRELARLFPGWHMEARSLTLAPPLARRLAPISWLAAAAAGQLPFLRTHLFARLRKPG